MESDPLPNSSDSIIYCERNRRPMLTSAGCLADVLRDATNDAFHLSIERVSSVANPSHWYYEAVVHRRSTTPDHRCVVARFRDLDEAGAAHAVLAAAWVESYAGPATGDIQPWGN